MVKTEAEIVLGFRFKGRDVYIERRWDEPDDEEAKRDAFELALQIARMQGFYLKHGGGTLKPGLIALPPGVKI